MAMNWLKGLVAPAAQFGAQQLQQGMQGQGQPNPNAPPIGGSPMPGQSPYGVQQGMQQPMQQPTDPQQQQPVGMGGGYQAPMQWSTGTRTQGQAQGVASASPAGGSNISGGGVSGSGGAQTLEQRVIDLQNNVDSLALFARTLLTMLEEQKVVTRPQFEATKNRLDMLDGKIDDK